MDILYWTIIAAALVGAFMYVDTKYLRNNKAKCRVLVHEQVGDEKVFLGAKIGLLKEDSKLGLYIKIGKKISIQTPNSRDFYYDKKYGRCLHVVKMSSDDYRPLSRMDKAEWFRLEQQEQYKKDKEGNFIPILDKDGKPQINEIGETLYETEIIQVPATYDEPKGISQTARESGRFNRAYQKRMEELKKEKQGWWNEHGVQVLQIGVIVIFMIFLSYNQNNYFKAMKDINIETSEALGEAIEAVNKPSWVEGVFQAAQRKGMEDQTPQS